MKKIFIVMALVGVVVGSCVKMPNFKPTDPDEKGDKIEVPNNFDWKTTKEVSFNIEVSPLNGLGQNLSHIIKIYNSPLLNEGSLVASGVATATKPYRTILSVADITEKLYIYELKPNGLATVTEKEIVAPTVSVKLQNGSNPLITKSGTFFAANVLNPAPTIETPTNYDVIIDHNNSIETRGFTSGNGEYGNPYKSFLIPEGFTRTAQLNFTNWEAGLSIIFVKGTLNLSNDVEANMMSLVILEGGKVNMTEFKNGGSSSTWGSKPFIYIHKGGELNISKNLYSNDGVNVVNKGTLTIANNLSINGFGELYNEGVIQLTSSSSMLDITNNCKLFNSNSITTSLVEFSNGAQFVNDHGATLTANDFTLHNDVVIDNYGEIAVTNQLHINGSGTVNNHCRVTTQTTNISGGEVALKEGSLWNTQNLKMNKAEINMEGGSMMLINTIDPDNLWDFKFINSSSTPALIKHSGQIPDLKWKQSFFSGAIEVVNGSFTEGEATSWAQYFKEGATLVKEQSVNIPGTACNQSLGQLEEESPEEPEIPDFENYFPSKEGWGTYAFEDMWPFEGDYDLNDLVLRFRVAYTTNSSNQVTKMNFKYQILAAGAAKVSGAAIQLDKVSASSVASVEGQILKGGIPFATSANGTEQGVDLAVIPLFNNIKDIKDFDIFYLNTLPNKKHIIFPTVDVEVIFTAPIPQELLTMSNFNFFIAVEERKSEIHLPSYPPTTKYDKVAAERGSINPTDLYKLKNGMMWGLMFPESFDYPVEQVDINDAYRHFEAWATSGGVSYPDWYTKKEGYRDEELIYKPRSN